MIAIIDYRMGNLRSVQKGFEHAGVRDVVVTDDPEVVRAADGIVLPGVGAFRDASANLKASGLWELLLSRVAAGTPFLGICLGMQLLASVGLEDGEWEGLGMIPGTCERLPGGVKIPHIGWNTVAYPRESRLFDGIPADTAFYFVHSYHLRPSDPSCIIGSTEYGVPFAAAVQAGSAYAVQFHPEKSSDMGLRLLANFGAIVTERGSR
ncbi:MAG: imidazole glycerol phosphate synthase subunit HisH [Actinobacteria bacterium]|nr:MAG: imidazole glycerol phosphate synthase subunit HisH [Actinomycetota bacterium]